MRRRIKFFIAIFFVCLYSVALYSQTSSLRIQFVKGNISDKISAVQKATGEDGFDLARAAISFAIENVSILGSDRELATLAVAGILALPDNYRDVASSASVNNIAQELIYIFEKFSDSNVKIAVIGKIVQFAPEIINSGIINVFNGYILNADASTDIAVLRQLVQAIGGIGDAYSFTVLYDKYISKAFPSLETDIETALDTLAEKSTDYIYGIVSSGETRKIRPIFDIFEKSAKNNNNFKAEIAEKTILMTINNAGNQKQTEGEVLSLQIDSLRILARLNWTHASSMASNFFDIAVDAYEKGLISVSDFIDVIAAVAKLSPIESPQKFSKYLSDLNGTKAKRNSLSDDVVRAVISALGSLGNKNAFDALLAVTYLDYPDDIVALARDSLARLRW